MKDASLIIVSIAPARSKAYWDALTNDFEDRLRICKHEIVREERNLPKEETNPSYITRVLQGTPKLLGSSSA
jgi:hypothetical protein